MQKFLRRRLNDGIFFAVLMVLLGGFAILLHINPAHPSGADHFILQAQAWLHGHLDIGRHVNDAILVGGKYYIVFPPLPALLMLPFIVILGSRFSDIWFTWAFAALNMLLLFRTLEVMRVRRIINRLPLENLIMALTFGFGTIALWLCLGGDVWFTSQTISIFGILLTLHSTLSRRWPLATLGLGMVVLTRTSEVLIGIVPFVVYLHDLGIGRRTQDRWHFLPQRWPSVGELVVMLTPFAVALLILLVHNKFYFGNPLSTGYEIHDRQDTMHFKYGILSWHYIWPNFVVDFLRWPSFYFSAINDVSPRPDLVIDGIGTSMFFSTPLLAIFLFAPQGKTAQTWLRNTLWVTVAILLVSILSFQAAGGAQVGARYVFPLYPLLFLLLAQRAAPLDTRWISLAGLSVFINLLLARTSWKGAPGNVFVVGSASIVFVVCMIAIFLLRRQKRQLEEIAPLAPIEMPDKFAHSDEATGRQNKKGLLTLDKNM
jgi:hypothetical protein